MKTPAFLLLVSLFISTESVGAQDSGANETFAANNAEKKPKQKRPDPNAIPDNPRRLFIKLSVTKGFIRNGGASITNAQWPKVRKIDALYGPIMDNYRKKLTDLLTDEQKAKRQNAEDANLAQGHTGYAARDYVDRQIGYTDQQLSQKSYLEGRLKRLRRDINRVLLRVLREDQLKPFRHEEWFHNPVATEFVQSVKLDEFQRQAIRSLDERMSHIERHLAASEELILTPEQRAAGAEAFKQAKLDGAEKPFKIEIEAQNRTDVQNEKFKEFDSLRSAMKAHVYGQLVSILTPEQWSRVTPPPNTPKNILPGGVAIDLPEIDRIKLSVDQMTAVRNAARWYKIFIKELDAQRFAPLGELNEEDTIDWDDFTAIERRADQRMITEIVPLLTPEQAEKYPKADQRHISEHSAAAPLPGFSTTYVGDIELLYSQQVRLGIVDEEYSDINAELDRQRALLAADLEHATEAAESASSQETKDQTAEDSGEDRVPIAAESQQRIEEAKNSVHSLERFAHAAEERALSRLRSILTEEQVESVPGLQPILPTDLPVVVESANGQANLVELFIDWEQLSDAQRETAKQLQNRFSPKLEELRKAWDVALTDEQRTAAESAKKKAISDGISTAEQEEAVKDALVLSVDQLFLEREIHEDEQELLAEFLTALKDVLTEEQLKLLKTAGRNE